MAELLALLIEEFEKKHYEIKAATPADVLTELMDANNLKSKDLVDIFGSESTASAVMHGTEDLTKEHIEKLSARFSVSPAVFF